MRCGFYRYCGSARAAAHTVELRQGPHASTCTAIEMAMRAMADCRASHATMQQPSTPIELRRRWLIAPLVECTFDTRFTALPSERSKLLRTESRAQVACEQRGELSGRAGAVSDACTLAADFALSRGTESTHLIQSTHERGENASGSCTSPRSSRSCAGLACLPTGPVSFRPASVPASIAFKSSPAAPPMG